MASIRSILKTEIHPKYAWWALVVIGLLLMTANLVWGILALIGVLGLVIHAATRAGIRDTKTPTNQ